MIGLADGILNLYDIVFPLEIIPQIEHPELKLFIMAGLIPDYH